MVSAIPEARYRICPARSGSLAIADGRCANSSFDAINDVHDAVIRCWVPAGPADAHRRPTHEWPSVLFLSFSFTFLLSHTANLSQHPSQFRLCNGSTSLTSSKVLRTLQLSRMPLLDMMRQGHLNTIPQISLLTILPAVMLLYSEENPKVVLLSRRLTCASQRILQLYPDILRKPQPRFSLMVCSESTTNSAKYTVCSKCRPCWLRLCCKQVSITYLLLCLFI